MSLKCVERFVCGEASTYTDDKSEVYVEFLDQISRIRLFLRQIIEIQRNNMEERVHMKDKLAKEAYFTSDIICFIDNAMTKRCFCQTFLLFKI